MNLNKYTKAELISRFKKLENKNSNSISEGIISKLLLFKSLILKLTLFAFIIKTFKKYSIFRRIWVILNTIVMTIFGISLLDIYGISIIANFYLEFVSIVGNIVNYLTHTHFYTVLSGLWASKVEIKEPSNVLGLGTNNKNATGSENSSKINDWFNKQEVVEDKSSNTKYYIIGALFLISCLTWYYYGDNITPVVTSGIDKIKSSFRRKPGNDGNISSTNIDNDLQNNSWSNTLWNIWDKVKSKFTRNNQPPSDPDSLTPNTPAQIELINKSTKYPNVDSPQLLASSSKLSPIAEVSEKSSPSTGWIGENAMDQYFSKEDVLDKGKGIDVTNLSKSELDRRVLEQVTGESIQKFEIESEDIINKMSHFIATHENQAFPNSELEKGICSLLSTQMTILYMKYKKYYFNWIAEPANDEIFSKFQAIEEKIKSSNEVEQSNKYEEVAKSTAHEQDIWSDDANSSVHSPYVKEEKFDSDSKVELAENQKSMFGPFVNELNKLPDQPNILEQVDAEVKAEALKAETPKPTINDLWNQIKARRNDSDVIDDTNKEPIVSASSSDDNLSESSESTNELEHYLPESQQTNVETNVETKVPENTVENPEIIVDSPKELASATEQTSETWPLTSILETVKGLLTPKTENKNLETETNVEETSQDAPKSGFINLFESIKARRDDSNVVSSPKVAQVGLQTPIHERLDVTPKGSPLIKKPSISNLLEDTNALFDLDEDDVSSLKPIIEENNDNLISTLNINWDQIAPRIVDGIKTEIDFKDIWGITDEVIITTNKNHDIRYKFDELGIDSLSSKTVSFNINDKLHNIGAHFPDVQIREIFITDTSKNRHSIYKV